MKCKRRRLDVPERWLECPTMGDLVNDMFVPFKTPLGDNYDPDVPAEKRFTIGIFLDLKKTWDIGMVIDLTTTNLFYNYAELSGTKCYSKMAFKSISRGPPSVEQVNSFINIAHSFFVLNQDAYVGVHCTHGYNKTGFMIVSYLCERCDMELDEAIHVFASSRYPGIFNQEFIDELVYRYDFAGILRAPPVPNWTPENVEKYAMQEPREPKSKVYEPTEQEPMEQEEMEQEAVHQEPTEQEAIQQESTEQEPMEQEALHQEPTEQEPTEQEVVQPERKNEEPTTKICYKPAVADSESVIINRAPIVSSCPNKKIVDRKTSDTHTRRRERSKDILLNPDVRGVTKTKVINVVLNVLTRVKEIMRSNKLGFVGTHHVAVTLENLALIAESPYLVTWSAVGTRCLLFILQEHMVFLINHENIVFDIENISFPKNSTSHLTDTLMDGELVIDVFEDSRIPRYLVSDIMTLNGDYVGGRSFANRIELVKSIIDIRNKILTPEKRSRESFSFRAKVFWKVEQARELWEGDFRKAITHEMDGLLFYPNSKTDFYVMGKSTRFLKWKPPSITTIDFRLRVEFIRSEDLSIVPRYVGYLYVSGLAKEFASIDNIKREWRQKYDKKIVASTLDTKTLEWKIVSESPGKSCPDHISTAKILLSRMRDTNEGVYICHLYDAIDYSVKYRQRRK